MTLYNILVIAFIGALVLSPMIAVSIWFYKRKNRHAVIKRRLSGSWTNDR